MHQFWIVGEASKPLVEEPVGQIGFVRRDGRSSRDTIISRLRTFHSPGLKHFECLLLVMALQIQRSQTGMNVPVIWILLSCLRKNRKCLFRLCFEGALGAANAPIGIDLFDCLALFRCDISSFLVAQQEIVEAGFIKGNNKHGPGSLNVQNRRRSVMLCCVS